MATLKVKAEPSAGVGEKYMVLVDGNVVATDDAGNGTVQVSGGCGDGSKHMLLYAFEGKAGETLSVTITCGGNPVCLLKKAVISKIGEPHGAGRKGFSL